MRNAYKIVAWKLEEKISHGRPRRRLKADVITDVKIHKASLILFVYVFIFSLFYDAN
jgi:hypothetical protein